jgi:hypothetical protein
VKRKDIREMLENESKEDLKDLKFFFTDCFDLGNPWDETRREVKELVLYSRQIKIDLETPLLLKCIDFGRISRRQKLISVYLRIVNGKVMRSLGSKEKELFEEKIKDFMEDVLENDKI